MVLLKKERLFKYKIRDELYVEKNRSEKAFVVFLIENYAL